MSYEDSVKFTVKILNQTLLSSGIKCSTQLLIYQE